MKTKRFAKRRNITVEQLTNELQKVALDNRQWVNLLTMLKGGIVSAEVRHGVK